MTFFGSMVPLQLATVTSNYIRLPSRGSAYMTLRTSRTVMNKQDEFKHCDWGRLNLAKFPKGARLVFDRVDELKPISHRGITYYPAPDFEYGF